MVSPWSTNAVEIAQNMGIDGIARIEEFIEAGNGQAAPTPCCSALIMASTRKSSTSTNRNRLSKLQTSGIQCK